MRKKPGLLGSWVGFLDRHAPWIIAGHLVLLAWGGFQATKVRIVGAPMEQLFSTPNELIRNLREVRDVFGANTRVIAVSVETHGTTHVTNPQVYELMEGISGAFKRASVIRRESVLSLTTVRDFTAKGDEIDATPLMAGLERTRAGETKLQERIRANPLVYGRLVSKDFRTAMVIGIAYDQFSREAIHDDLSQLLAPYTSALPGVSVSLAGDVEVNYQINRTIRKDLWVFLLLSLGLTVFSFYVLFRSWQGVVFPVLSIVISTVITMGLIGAHGEPIHFVSATLPVFLIVVAGAFSIHIYQFLRDRLVKGERFADAYEDVLKEILSPVMMSAVSTVMGGISLLSFKTTPIQHFGFFAAVGTAVSLVVTLALIPSLLRVFSPRVEEMGHAFSKGLRAASDLAGVRGGVKGIIRGFQKVRLVPRLLAGLAGWATKYSKMVVILFGCLTVVGAVFVSRIEVGFDETSLLPNGNRVREVTERLDRAMGGLISFDVMVDARKPNGVLTPDVLAAVSEFERRAKEVPLVNHTFSINHILERVHALLGGKGKLPGSPEALAQYLLLVRMAGGGLNINDWVTSDQGKLRLTITPGTVDSADIERVYARLVDLGKEVLESKGLRVVFGGSQAVTLAVMRNLVWGKVQNILLTLLMIFLLIAFVHLSISRAFINVAALLVGVLANFGLMAVAGIRLDLVTAIVTSIAMGMGLDFTIHIVSAIREQYKKSRSIDRAIRDAMGHSGRAVLHNALSNMMGFSVLLFSGFTATRVLAILMCFSMFALSVSALLFVPALIKWIEPEFVTGKRRMLRVPQKKGLAVAKLAGGTVFLLILTIGALVLNGWTAELSANAMLDRSVRAMQVSNEEATYTMKLIDSTGSQTVRRMRVFFKSDGDDKAKLFIRFTEPADIRGTGFLTLVQKGKSGDQWLYLPAIKKSRRMKGGNSDEPFLGSDFSMSDLSVDRSDGYEYTLQGMAPCGATECHQIVGVPPKGEDRLYSKKVILLKKETYITFKQEFYNPSGMLEKVMMVSKIHQDGKRWVVDSVEMKNVLSRHQTVIEFEKRNGASVPDHVFTVSNLERG